jgi:hypothetical protein
VERIYVGALIGFTYLGRRKSFPQLIYCGEKYSQIKLVNTQNNIRNILVNYWYLNANLLTDPIFISEC